MRTLASALMVTLPELALRRTSLACVLTNCTFMLKLPVPACTFSAPLLSVQVALLPEPSDKLTWVPNKTTLSACSPSKLPSPKLNAWPVSPKVNAAKLLSTMAVASAASSASLPLPSTPPCNTS